MAPIPNAAAPDDKKPRRLMSAFDRGAQQVQRSEIRPEAFIAIPPILFVSSITEIYPHLPAYREDDERPRRGLRFVPPLAAEGTGGRKKRPIAAGKLALPSLNEIQMKRGQIFAGCPCDSCVGYAFVVRTNRGLGGWAWGVRWGLC